MTRGKRTHQIGQNLRRDTRQVEDGYRRFAAQPLLEELVEIGFDFPGGVRRPRARPEQEVVAGVPQSGSEPFDLAPDVRVLPLRKIFVAPAACVGAW